MSFESRPSVELSPKDVFMEALNQELADMVQSGRISPEQAEEKKISAALIEEGFSNDPAHDALLFSRGGIAGEEELIEIINGSKTNSGHEASREKVPFNESFFVTVKAGIDEFLEKEELPEEYAKGVLERAEYIGGPFLSEEDAEEKGQEFLKAIEPIAEFMRGLKNAEVRLLAFTKEIDLAMGTVSESNINGEKKREITETFQVISKEIEHSLDAIQSAREQIV